MNTIPIRELIPQSGPMVMLDEVVSVDEHQLTARFTPRADNLFVHNGIFGSWVGIECMAQAMAALVGWQARQRGEAVKIGLLLGTRRFQCEVDQFALDKALLVSARSEFTAENGIGVMECEIRDEADQLLAQAALTAYQPDNFKDLLEAPV